MLLTLRKFKFIFNKIKTLAWVSIYRIISATHARLEAIDPYGHNSEYIHAEKLSGFLADEVKSTHGAKALSS